MRKLEPLFKEREIAFDAKNNRIGCFPHIINIVAQHVIKKISRSVAADADDAFVFEKPRNEGPNRVPPTTFEEACASDPLSKVRKIIVAIRASGQRRDEFNSWIQMGMYFCLFELRSVLNLLRKLKGLVQGPLWIGYCYSRKATFKGCENSVGQHLPNVDDHNRHASGKCFFHPNFLPLIIFNCQAVDTFLESPQCLDIKDYKLFDKEWDVLVDIAHVLMVKSRKFLML